MCHESVMLHCLYVLFCKCQGIFFQGMNIVHIGTCTAYNAEIDTFDLQSSSRRIRFRFNNVLRIALHPV